MRGRLQLSLVAMLRVGSIPAYAGETFDGSNLVKTSGVDPRVCGGDRKIGDVLGRMPGRSPRMRGRHCRGIEKWCNLRSIPAYAGETQTASPAGWPGKVDPRVCGGDREFIRQHDLEAGRSPRMRGRRPLADRQRRRRRSIPAYAGETHARVEDHLPFQVDPRVCGGDPKEASGAVDQSGRSPRMRGRQCLAAPRSMHLGSIPAYAGETLDVYLLILQQIVKERHRLIVFCVFP